MHLEKQSLFPLSVPAPDPFYNEPYRHMLFILADGLVLIYVSMAVDSGLFGSLLSFSWRPFPPPILPA